MAYATGPDQQLSSPKTKGGGHDRGSTGVEGSEPVPYDVLTFDREGISTIYESRRSGKPAAYHH